MNKHERNRWKSKTPVNMALELNVDRDDEPTQEIFIDDPQQYLDDIEDEEPTLRRRIAHSYSGRIDDMKELDDE